MSLSNFFTVNLPYGIKSNEKGHWMAFNREYMPLGWNDEGLKSNGFYVDSFQDQPIFCKYKGLTESKLLKLSWNGEKGVRRDEKGRIVIVWFYNDGSNPSYNLKCWPEYFERIKILSRLTRDRNGEIPEDVEERFAIDSK